MPRSMPKPEQQTQNKVAHASDDIVADQISKLATLMPQVMTEGKVDFDKLREALGEAIDDRPERYSFSWAGKRDAIRALQTSSSATLIPAEGESVGFADTGNVFIEGDNLEVLKLLHKSYFGRVKCIYIDPPYNTGNDFVYPDDFADPLGKYLELTGQKDGSGNHLTSNAEGGGRFHSSWLTMMYPRLFLARQMLREDGVIFISIDDHEVHNLRLLMNEIFGEENFVDTVIWKKRYGGGAKEKHLVSLHEYALLYAKNKEALPPIFIANDPEAIERYYKLKDEKYERLGAFRTHPLEATKSMGERKNLVYPIPAPDGTQIYPKRQWLWARERVEKALKNNDLLLVQDKEGNWSVNTKQYLKDEQGNVRQSKAFSMIDNVYTQHGTNEIISLFGDAQVFSFPKPVGLVKPLLEIGTAAEENDIVMDFFAGSGTTAHAMFNLNREDGGNRRFVLVQLPQPTNKQDYSTIADICKARIGRVISQLQNADQNESSAEDLGFRAFKYAPSNFNQWQTQISGTNDPQTYIEQMTMLTDPLVEGWTPENVIWEVAIREGYSLSSRVEHLSPTNATKRAKGNMVYRVNDADKGQTLHICLDETVMPDVVAHLGLGADDLFVCRDIALDDEGAANLALQCRLKTL